MTFQIILIISLYIACELIANITASKPVALIGNISVPAAVFIYAITFTLIDLINERLGKNKARYVVYAAFIANLLLAGYVQFAIWLPPVDFFGSEGQIAFKSVLGSTWRIVIASLSAYLISSLIDVQIFAWWKKQISKYKWARVLISNSISTLVDSIVFIIIAFWGILPVLPLITGQYIVKMIITVISIPLIYLVRKN